MNRPADPSSIYKSPEGRAAIMQWYDQQVARLPVSPASRWVTTSIGRTHLLVSGPEEAPPLFVLHGMNLNAAAMAVAIRQLSALRRVYAVDIIGMPGKSVGVRPSRSGPDYPRWLNEVMEALGIVRADFLGQSFGGWLILKLGAMMPSRIHRTVLLDAGGLVPFTLSGQVVAGFAALRYIIWPSDKNLMRAVRPFYAPHRSPKPRLVELLGRTYQHTRMDVNLSGLPVLTREDLAEMNGPVFVSYGKHDIFFRARRAIRKAEELWPDSAVTEIVEDEGHLFTEEGERNVYNRVATFLNHPVA